jgi:hypothetical protein
MGLVTLAQYVGLVTLAQYMVLATLAQWFNSISVLHSPGSQANSLFISGAGYPCSIFGAGYPCLNFAFYFKIYLLPSSLNYLTNTSRLKPSLDKHLQLLLKKWASHLDCLFIIYLKLKTQPPTPAADCQTSLHHLLNLIFIAYWT